MPMVLAGAALVVAAAGTAMQIDSSRRSANMTKDAQDQARVDAEKQAKLTEESTNKASQKTANTSTIMSAAQQAAKGGVSSTMLTGSPSGIDTSALSLGKTSLLGG